MSLILDALRKMEQDRKGRTGPAGVLRPDVLRYRARTAKRRRSMPYLLICGVVLLGGGVAAGMFALGRHNAVPVAAAPSATTTSVAESAQVAAPAPAPVTLPPAAPAPPAPAAVQPKQITDTAVAAAPSPAAAEATPVNAELPRQPKPAQAKRVRLPQATPERHDAPESAQPAPQDIAISGIAWQEERNLRRAVLNGTLVAEGAVVAGARVVEIKEDRVRLFRAGQSFEIPFSSALSSR